MQSPHPPQQTRQVEGSLNHFRLNPFRILGVSIDCDSQEAIWAAERLIAMSAVGIEPVPEETYLSIVGPNPEAEIRQTITQIEEPFERLVEELFWFDFRHLSNAAQLESYLRNNDLLSLFVLLSEQSATEYSTVTDQINLANLELLIGILSLNNISTGLEISEETEPLIEDESLKPVKKKRALKFKWVKQDGFSIVENPHLLIAKKQKLNQRKDDTLFWFNHLKAAFKEWHSILSKENWPNYVQEKIARLNDELLDESTIVLLKQIIPTRLADLIAIEVKKATRDSDFLTVNQLLKTANQSNFDSKTVRNALTQTKVLFQNEIRQADELLGKETEHLTLYDIKNHLDALTKIKNHWFSYGLGSYNDLLGLRHLLDQSVNKAFQAIYKLELTAHSIHERKGLLNTLMDVATNQSTIERIREYQTSIEGSYEGLMCHFCEKHLGDWKCPVVLKGRKETGSDGNTTYYSIRYVPISRCESCSTVHEFINGWAAFIGGIFYVIILIFIIQFFGEMGAGMEFDSSIIWVLFFIIYVMIRYLPMVLAAPYHLARYIVAAIATPSSHRKYHDISGTDSRLKLREEDYSLTQIMIAKNALTNAQSHSKQ